MSNPKIENIVVCGVGAAGANILTHLIYMYPTLNFTVVDFDKVEARNWEAGTQPYNKIDLGRPKTQAIQRIAMALKEKKINAINKKITSGRDIEALTSDLHKTLFIDAFDNADSRNLFLKMRGGCHILHIGFSAALTGEAVWDGVFSPMTESKKDAAIDVCEMTLARPFIFALTSLAVMNIVAFIEKGEKNNLYFDSHFIVRKF